MSARDAEPDATSFAALEYCEDDAFRSAHYVLRRDPAGHWTVERNGRRHLALGPGHRLVRTRACGVCSTDLDRRFLPFPLPQVTGHEAVVEDERGARAVVEINASHRARNEPDCAFCAAGLPTHCPSRLVLGIHDLPGGFAPWLLAPVGALVPLPDAIPDETATLVEPFAAALRAVDVVDPQPGSTVAVLGPRRLGMLVVAALAARRRADGRAHRIVALARRPELRALALALGADEATTPPAGADEASPMADVVIDTTGTPEGLAIACACARHEVHLKSTHGQPALGCARLTEAVVDEITIAGAMDADAIVRRLADVEPLSTPSRLRVGWLGRDAPPAAAQLGAHEVLHARDAGALLDALEAGEEDAPALPRVDALVVDDARDIDAALRPRSDREVSPLRPRGLLLVRAPGGGAGPELPIAEPLARGLEISTSRCGDFRTALGLMERDGALRRLGERLITHRYPASGLADAFATARSRDAIKVIVRHDGQ